MKVTWMFCQTRTLWYDCKAFGLELTCSGYLLMDIIMDLNVCDCRETRWVQPTWKQNSMWNYRESTSEPCRLCGTQVCIPHKWLDPLALIYILMRLSIIQMKCGNYELRLNLSEIWASVRVHSPQGESHSARMSTVIDKPRYLGDLDRVAGVGEDLYACQSHVMLVSPGRLNVDLQVTAVRQLWDHEILPAKHTGNRGLLSYQCQSVPLDLQFCHLQHRTWWWELAKAWFWTTNVR